MRFISAAATAGFRGQDRQVYLLRSPCAHCRTAISAVIAITLNLIGGKGGTRTLDRGTMSAGPGNSVGLALAGRNSGGGASYVSAPQRRRNATAGRRLPLRRETRPRKSRQSPNLLPSTPRAG
jgi:hypothetical protein